MARSDEENSKFIVDANIAKKLGLKKGSEVDFHDLTPKQQRMMMYVNQEGTYDDEGYFTPKEA